MVRFRKKMAMLIAALLCSLLLLFNRYAYLLQGATSISGIVPLSGDIVFIEGKSWRSMVVNLLDLDNQCYTHVGIVSTNDGTVKVVHASPTSSSTKDGIVCIEPLEIFLSTQNCAKATIYRLRQDSCRLAILSSTIAETFANNRLPFDNDFSLTTDESLYCTELVWKAYLLAGIDLINADQKERTQFISSGKYLWPSQLMKSRFLRAIKVQKVGGK